MKVLKNKYVQIHLLSKEALDEMKRMCNENSYEFKLKDMSNGTKVSLILHGDRRKKPTVIEETHILMYGYALYIDEKAVKEEMEDKGYKYLSMKMANLLLSEIPKRIGSMELIFKKE